MRYAPRHDLLMVLDGTPPPPSREHVYKLPEHRRRGLAGALVGHAAREARAAGASLVFLVASAEGEAVRLYRRLGFADAGLLPRFRMPAGVR